MRLQKSQPASFPADFDLTFTANPEPPLAMGNLPSVAGILDLLPSAGWPVLLRVTHRARAQDAHGKQGNYGRQVISTQQSSMAIARMKSRIVSRESHNEAAVELLGEDSLEDRFAALDREERIETLLKDLKAKQLKPA